LYNRDKKLIKVYTQEVEMNKILELVHSS